MPAWDSFLEAPLVTRDEFERTIQSIDEGLKARDVPIHARPTVALVELAKRLNVEEDIPLTTRVANPDDFSGSALGGQIHSWYERHYGERLNVDMRLGSVLVDIRGDAWEMVVFNAYGRILLACDPSSLGDRQQRRAPGGGGVIYNVLNSIEKLPQHLADSLTDAEKVGLLTAFKEGFEALSAINDARASPYVPEALSDLADSVRCVMDRRPDGQSKWASLQFTEKLMKSRLEAAGVPFKKTHDLEELEKLVRPLSYAVSNADLLAISCPAGVRYGQVPVSRAEAVGAHQAALRVARSLGFCRRATP
jgi:hypothetical protein